MNPEAQSLTTQNPEFQRLAVLLVPKETCTKSNCQEPGGSTSDRLMIVLKKIHHMRAQNKITAPFINNKQKTDTTLKCNSLHQKYADINENTYTSE